MIELATPCALFCAHREQRHSWRMVEWRDRFNLQSAPCSAVQFSSARGSASTFAFGVGVLSSLCAVVSLPMLYPRLIFFIDRRRRMARLFKNNEQKSCPRQNAVVIHSTWSPRACMFSASTYHLPAPAPHLAHHADRGFQGRTKRAVAGRTCPREGIGEHIHDNRRGSFTLCNYFASSRSKTCSGMQRAGADQRPEAGRCRPGA